MGFPWCFPGASEQAKDLKGAAEQAFRKGFLRLVTVDGFLVNPKLSIDNPFHQGRFFCVAERPRLAATDGAMVAVLGPSRVITWGDPRHGGDASKVQDQLQHVQDSGFEHPVEGKQRTCSNRTFLQLFFFYQGTWLSSPFRRFNPPVLLSVVPLPRS